MSQTPGGGAAPGTAPPDPRSRSLDELFARERAHLVRVAAVLTQDGQEAEDVVQDAFVALHKRWPLEDPERAAGYLRVSVINAARSSHRRVALFRRHARPDSTVAPPADTPLLLREEYAEVVKAVRRLPRRQQQVIALRYWSELGDAQIATTLGISPATVRATASRAIGSIARNLERSR